MSKQLISRREFLNSNTRSWQLFYRGTEEPLPVRYTSQDIVSNIP